MSATKKHVMTTIGVAELWEDHDFVIKVGSVEIPANRKKLMKMSSYFEAMLSNDMLESKCGFVVMKSVDAEAVKKCVDFIHTQPVVCVSFSYHECEELMRAARIMQLEPLCDDITHFLDRKLSLETFFHIKKIAYENDLEVLERACDIFAVENFQQLVVLKGFEIFDSEYLEYLVTSKHCSTIVNFNNLLFWTELNPTKRLSTFHKILNTLDIHKIPPSYQKFLVKNQPLIHENAHMMKIFARAVMNAADVYGDVVTDRTRNKSGELDVTNSSSDVRERPPEPSAKKPKTTNNCSGENSLEIFFHRIGNCATKEEEEAHCHFAMTNFDEIANHDRFGEIDDKLILLVLQENNTKSPPTQKLRNFIRWLNFDHQNRHKILDVALANLDIFGIVPEYLHHLIETENIVSECPKCLKILTLVMMDKTGSDECDLTAENGANSLLFLFQQSGNMDLYKINEGVLQDVGSFEVEKNDYMFFSVVMENFLYQFVLDGTIRRLDLHRRICRLENMEQRTNTWEDGKTYGVSGPAAILSGCIYIYDYNTQKSHTVIYKYDPESGDVSCADIIDIKLASPCLVPAHGYLFCIGGYVKKRHDDVATNEVRKYDPATDTWWLMSQMLLKRGDARASAVGGKIFVLGGYSTPTDCLFSAEMYDVRTDTWMKLPRPLRTWSSCSEQVLTISGDIFVVGGNANDNRATEDDPFPPFELMIDMFNIEKACWTEVEFPPYSDMSDYVVAVTL